MRKPRKNLRIRCYKMLSAHCSAIHGNGNMERLPIFADSPSLLQLLKLKEQREALKLQGQKHEDTIMKVLITILNDVEKELKISCCNLHLCRKMPSFRRR